MNRKLTQLMTRLGLALTLASLPLISACGGGSGESATSQEGMRDAATQRTEASDAGGIRVDPGVPSYERTAGVSGNLNAVGSDTLNNLMTMWAEGYRRNYPNVRIQIEGKGSSTAPPALIQGVAQLGPMSRQMKSSERDKFEDEYGFPPTAIPVALDALAVYVNKDNPIESLSIPEVDAIFSKANRCGHAGDISTWGGVGLEGDWKNKSINLYGRNSASGTYGYFKEHALCKGDYKDTVKEQPGSASVVQGVTEDLYGIGYSGIGYKTSGVKAIAIAPEEGAEPRPADMKNVNSQEYPLARYLYVYIVDDPNRPLDPLVREFLRFVLSKEGQEVVIKDGYLPLSAETVAEQRARLAQ